MRPLRLTVQAFGPFQQRETIDFTCFGERPLFLINGATGSGKTTLLDAMCFALYGQTTGGEREARQMRSDHADGTLLAEVDFTFALGEQTYRVLRQPDQERPKLRGDGTTKQEARADFWRIESDGHETALSVQKVNTANQAIEAKIGLSAAQFRQVIVLPQGQFRQLLLAGSNEREAIFSRLFQTHAYRVLEKRLHEHASSIRQQADAVTKRQEGILSTISLDDAAQLKAELDTLLSTQAAALTHKQQCETNYRAAQEYQRCQQTLNTCQQELQQHEQTLRQAKQALVSTENALQDKQKKLQPEQQALQRQLIELENLRPHLQPLQTAQHKVIALQKQQQQEEHQLRNLQQDITRIETQFSERQQQINTLRTNQQAIASLELALHRHEAQVKHLQQRQTLQDEHAKLTEQQDKAKQRQSALATRSQSLQTECKQLELAWHQGQAMLLARELKADQACPVCGSKKHPNPAHGDLFPPSQQELEQARKTAKTAADEQHQAALNHEQINTQLRAAQQQLAVLLQAAPADLPTSLPAEQIPAKLTELRQTLQQLTTKLKQHHTEVLELPKLEQLLSEQQNTLAQQQETQNQQQQTLQHTQHALQRALAETELLEQQLPAEYRADKALEQAIANTQHTLTQQQNQLQQAEADWHAQQQKTQEHAAQHKAIQDRYQAAEQALVNTTASQATLNTTESELAAAEQQLQQLSSRLHQLQQADKQYRHNKKQQDKFNASYKIAGTLADLANGRTHHRLSLQRFVLGVLLDDVLLAATSRFYQMSKGRYELQRKETRTKGNKASGLDLMVTDTYTGKQREVATLSGGESFMAALSLALGLSDVIQGYAGGIRLDTLFIDEGFGSLDEESLELAIRTLTELRDSGRMVGIISHVAELKQQIPQRLDVISGRNGSRVTVHAN